MPSPASQQPRAEQYEEQKLTDGCAESFRVICSLLG